MEVRDRFNAFSAQLPAEHKSAVATAKLEFRASREAFERIGISEDDYLMSCLVDDGVTDCQRSLGSSPVGRQPLDPIFRRPQAACSNARTGPLFVVHNQHAAILEVDHGGIRAAH